MEKNNGLKVHEQKQKGVDRNVLYNIPNSMAMMLSYPQDIYQRKWPVYDILK